MDSFFVIKCVISLLSKVNKLVGNYNFAGFKIFFEGADRANSDYSFHSYFFQSKDIGSLRNFVRRKLVFLSVTGQKSDFFAEKIADFNRGGRKTEGSSDFYLFFFFEDFRVIDPAPANDGNFNIGSHKNI
ncbi:MAG: hypothetical protein A2V70_00300 [Planctomycetes bacterium RBG_13_63_9]|nr:MAG: hypothetical protein A2V70_00300 [Planctomycetes bacterium RBG_13_63_9]